MNLLEKYEKRIAVSEALYGKEHGGASLPTAKKVAVATLLNNTSNFLNEAFSNSVGTQRADLGLFKKLTIA